MNASGERFEQPLPLSLKMEDLLRVVSAQRGEIAAAAGLRDSSMSRHHATQSQMKDMMNAWRNNVGSWMCIRNQSRYWDFKQQRNQDAHQFAKSCFTTYCFQLSGCRFLLHKLIELPIVRVGSAARPASSTIAVVKDLLAALQVHKRTDQYKKAVIASKKRMDDQERTSRQIWWARANIEQGRTLAEQRDEGIVDYYDLSCEDQELLEAYDTGKAQKKLRSLEAARSPVYRGTHVEASA